MTLMSTSEQAAVLAWANGENPPQPRRLLVLGTQGSAPATYHLFVCLYPDNPMVRMFRQNVPAGMELPDVRSALRNCKLPETAEQDYEAHMQVMFPTVSLRDTWGIAQVQARRLEQPLALYAYGRTAVRKVPRAQLYLNPLASPTQLLREFRKAAGPR